jgi:hypothetical protein
VKSFLSLTIRFAAALFMTAIVALVLTWIVQRHYAPSLSAESPGPPVAVPLSGLPSAVSPTHPPLSGRSGDFRR